MALTDERFERRLEEMAAMRGEMRAGFAAVRGDISAVRGDISAVRGDISAIRRQMSQFVTGLLIAVVWVETAAIIVVTY